MLKDHFSTWVSQPEFSVVLLLYWELYGTQCGCNLKRRPQKTKIYTYHYYQHKYHEFLRINILVPKCNQNFFRIRLVVEMKWIFEWSWEGVLCHYRYYYDEKIRVDEDESCYVTITIIIAKCNDIMNLLYICECKYVWKRMTLLLFLVLCFISLLTQFHRITM